MFLTSNVAVDQSNVLKNDTLTASAVDSYQALPLKIEGSSIGALPTTIGQSEKLPIAVKFNATIGNANLTFRGTAADVMHLNSLKCNYVLKDSSLAAVGDLVGVTLPTTAA